jgi:hypothetical protein
VYGCGHRGYTGVQVATCLHVLVFVQAGHMFSVQNSERVYHVHLFSVRNTGVHLSIVYAYSVAVAAIETQSQLALTVCAYRFDPATLAVTLCHSTGCWFVHIIS